MLPAFTGVFDQVSTAKRSQNLVEYSSERRKHLIHAPDKKRAVLVCEHCGMFGRQTKTFCCSVVVQITSRRHSAQPFAQIALVQFGSRRELSRCRRPFRRQIL